MSKKIVLKLSASRSYNDSEENNNTLTLHYLARFLTDDVQYSGFDNWKQIISNLKDEDYTGGNISFLDRREDKIIITNSLDENLHPNPITYEISIENLLEVLDQWEQLCKEKPKEIWIFEENGKVWLEGKN